MPIAQRQLSKLGHLATSKGEETELLSYQEGPSFQEKFLKNRFSILDVLEDYPSINLPFPEYLDMLQPLAPRQYSISSSPLAHLRRSGAQDDQGKEILTSSITYDVHSAPAFSSSAAHPRTFHGVCSSYLSALTPGTRIRCFVRATYTAFHLPADPSVPVIMIAAGTGIAPMRGFIEERAEILKAGGGGRTLGPALLYFGCRDYQYDYIYRAELEAWEALGAVSLRPCFSKRGPPAAADSHEEPVFHYTSDRIYTEREELANLFAQGSKIFLCGSASKLAKSTKEVCIKIYRERNPAKSVEEAETWFESIREERYVSDVFG